MSPRLASLSARLLAPLLAAVAVARADYVEDTLAAIGRSEVSFLRADSLAPFPPIAWVSARRYTETKFLRDGEGSPNATFEQSGVSAAAILPAYVGRRDLVLAGAYAAQTRFDHDDPALSDHRVATVMPIAGWLRQYTEASQLGTFFAPSFSSELDGRGSGGTQLYTGLIGTTRTSDRWLWIYGGVYENSFGDSIFYPYAGFVWQIDPRWTLSLIAPWPALVYAPADDWFFQLGAEPGGASWKIRAADDEAVAEFGAWDLTLAVGRRLGGDIWLRAGGGVSGLRSLRVSSGGETRLDADIDAHPMFFISVEFRP